MYQRWVRVRPAERVVLEAPLQRFIARHPTDARARIARVYLAWIYVEEGDLVKARALASETRRGPPGSARDSADVVEAAVRVREGRPTEALRLLIPLRGKIVDPEARYLFGEEIVRAAVSAKRWGLAVENMIERLAEAPPDVSDAIMAAVEEGLGRVPQSALESALGDLDRAARTSEDDSSFARTRQWMRKSIWKRLAQDAIRRRDSDLAARLLSSGPARLRTGDTGRALGGLATGGSVVPRVAGRAVGLVLALHGDSARRRSAEVAAGMSRALGLPEAASRPDSVRLLLRDDGGALDGVGRALAELAGDGAAVLVAGVDGPSALRASKYAELTGIPVIVLGRPHGLGKDATSTFVLGASESEARKLLSEELARRGAKLPVLVGSDGVPCDGSSPAAGRPRFPVAKWLRSGIDALVLEGTAACARDVLGDVEAGGLEPLVGLGLGCAELLASPIAKDGTIALSAGSFPYRPSAGGPVDLLRWVHDHHSPPTWFETLGHDAALLASSALDGFPLELVDEAEAVAELHRRARRSLLTATSHLWSTSRKGFDGSMVVEHDFRAVSR